MTTDDDLEYYARATFRKIEVREVQEVPYGSDEVHEIQFADVTIASHNEHNGYYGGICLTVCAA